MTAEATTERPPTPAVSDESDGAQITYTPEEAELRCYSPEEIWDMKLLPIKPSTLRKRANQRRYPHCGAGAKVSFKLSQIRAISEMYDIPAMAQEVSQSSTAAA